MPATDSAADAAGLLTRIRLQERFRNHPRNWYHWLFDHLQLPAAAPVLELGCGPGDLWLENRARLPHDLPLLLSDTSLEMLQLARRRLSASNANFHFLNNSALHLPLPDNSLGVVLAFGLFSLLPDPHAAMAEIRRVLRPGGRLYASAGSGEHLQELDALVHPFLPRIDYGGPDERFGLENGAHRLAAYFPQVSRYDYHDRLRFPQTGPVLAYLLSESGLGTALGRRQLAGLVYHVKRRLRAGPLDVTLHKGLFVAQKRPG